MVKWFGSTNALGSLKGWDSEGFAEMMQQIRERSKHWQDSVPEETRKQIMDSVSNALKEVRASIAAGSLKSLLGPADQGQASSSVSTSISTSISTTMVDDDGTVITMTGDGDQRNLTIKDKDGTVVFDGPISTEEQKEKVPEEYRKRIQDLTDMVNIEIEMDLPTE
jgi:hypothetical protein